MKSSTTTLNPYAQSYVPLSQRDVPNKEENYQNLPKEGPHGDSVVDDQKLKGQQVDAPHDVTYESPHDVPYESPDDMDAKFMDEESEMDLAYLQMTFPGVSDQSILDVYNVNRGDLEAAVDMLTHLESADDIPDGSGVEVSQEPIPSGECSSMKALNMTGESSSASGSSNLAVST